ncbi:methyltransferase-like protein 22 [Lepisosteus oculatus]|uniref:Methyltransferase 22, Kin17 lysine n=1 Tax=Lepisosteus oculatus TaxID=7918 RepID=W5MHZ2_LEPOC|nr:PREDICTED: methyltransferase-like protein 22 [Lepisosteus oculatus]XP_015216041.1 PREDICTED: methyltransferase-like protein 22 [Lepisosteus oculatus]
MDLITFRSDTVLSDVHLLLPRGQRLMARLNAAGQPVFVSRFKILQDGSGSACIPGNEVAVSAAPGERGGSPGEEEEGERGRRQVMESLLDEDGDLDVLRRPTASLRAEGAVAERDKVCPIILSKGEGEYSDEEESAADRDVIKIEHTMATPLEDVGKQVWRGAVFMADYILSRQQLFRGRTALELGAGTGITSVVLATVASSVYCTDVGQDLLSMCERNVELNKHILQPAGGEIKVRELDWLRDDFHTGAGRQFSWTEEDIADLHDNTTVLIAADVCYDDELTDGLFRTLYRIMGNLHNPSTAYFSIEKRLNFTLRHMDVSCEAYDHFRSCLEALGKLADGRTVFSVEQVPPSFPQFFSYERIGQLELWKITASPLECSKESTSEK